MGLAANIRRDIRFAGGLYRLLKRIKPITLDSDVLLCDDIEEAVDKFADHVALEDENRRLTYRELDALANRYAHWAKGRNIRRGETIALMMHNRVVVRLDIVRTRSWDHRKLGLPAMDLGGSTAASVTGQQA